MIASSALAAQRTQSFQPRSTITRSKPASSSWALKKHMESVWRFCAKKRRDHVTQVISKSALLCLSHAGCSKLATKRSARNLEVWRIFWGRYLSAITSRPPRGSAAVAVVSVRPQFPERGTLLPEPFGSRTDPQFRGSWGYKMTTHLEGHSGIIPHGFSNFDFSAMQGSRPTCHYPIC